MAKVRTWGTGLLFIALSISAHARVQCHCPKVPADGEGNTSCSASESGDRCTIDFNLFGRESEERAVQLLNRFSDIRIEPPANPDLSTDEALKALSASSKHKLLDAILVYITVAAGEQNMRNQQNKSVGGSVPLQDLKELVHAVRKETLATQIVAAFNAEAIGKWSTYSDQRLDNEKIPVSKTDHSVVAPGCLEFRTRNGLWMMFKTSWSPARIWPRCENSAE